jgi:hypothetical protein
MKRYLSVLLACMLIMRAARRLRRFGRGDRRG